MSDIQPSASSQANPPKNKENNVTYKCVEELANAILSQGELPSILHIRGLLNDVTVSNAKISVHLETWQKNLEQLSDTHPMKKQFMAIIKAEQDAEKKADELKPSLDLVRSTLEGTTTDGVMVVSKEGRFLYYNEKFISMYQLPIELMEAGDEQKALEYAMNQMVDPQAFYQAVSRTYSELEETFEVEVFFKDGRVFELGSRPHRVNGHTVGRVWSTHDVTQRRRAERALRIRNRAIEASPNGVLIIDVGNTKKTVIYANPAYARITEEPLGQIMSQPWDLLKKAQNLNKRLLKNVETAFAQRDEIRIELNWHQKNGTLCYVELYLGVVPEAENEGENTSQYYIGILSDITDRKALEQQLIHQATHDTLTNLPNRAMLIEHMKHVIAHAKRNNKIVATLFLDLDQFKLVNDSLGHDWGDQLLRQVSSRLKNCVRKDDIVARQGGDEFVIVLAFLEHEVQALTGIEKILEALRKPFHLHEGQQALVSATSSIGVSFYPKDGVTPKTLLKHADIAMYKAKEAGRNTFQIFNSNMHTQLAHRVQVELDLRRAIELQQFSLRFQPVVNLAEEKIVGFEALIRWERPTEGLVSPLDFIPIAEETGLIVPIGEWVLKTACSTQVEWRKKGLQTCLAVNVSSLQLRQNHFLSSVKNILHETGADPKFLHFEVTESTLMERAEKVMVLLDSLRALGLTLSIDDFGTGYSSLSYLKLFPINILKIDRSFVSDINDKSNVAIIQATIAIARSLEMTVIAEGVETKEQLDFLKELKCDEIQGYYYSPPVTMDEAEELLYQQLEGKKPFNHKKFI